MFENSLKFETFLRLETLKILFIDDQVLRPRTRETRVVKCAKTGKSLIPMGSTSHHHPKVPSFIDGIL